MNKVSAWALAATVLGTLPVPGKTGVNAVAGLGEANHQYSGDMLGSTALPQIGFTLEYRTPWVSVSNTPTLGYYYGRPVLEDWFGLEIGWDLAWARPALTAGIGMQTYSRKDFLSEGGEHRRVQEVRTPRGIGLRLWLFRTCYGEWQGRFSQEGRGGVPWWKMEFGYKVY